MNGNRMLIIDVSHLYGDVSFLEMSISLSYG